MLVVRGSKDMNNLRMDDASAVVGPALVMGRAFGLRP